MRRYRSAIRVEPVGVHDQLCRDFVWLASRSCWLCYLEVVMLLGNRVCEFLSA
jgi:hypothetical protein